MAGENKENGKEGGDGVVAKTAGLAIFAGIAASIFKNFNAKKPEEEFSQPIENPASKGLSIGGDKKKPSQTIAVFKGDTLWGLSQKYGVSVDQIKAANGFSNDTIYAGEKIIIP